MMFISEKLKRANINEKKIKAEAAVENNARYIRQMVSQNKIIKTFENQA